MHGSYLVTDRALCGDRTVEDVVLAAVRGGVSYVGFGRSRRLDVHPSGIRIRDILAPLAVPLIINDRVDVALAVGADGVHAGRGQYALRHRQDVMGPWAIIGLSVENGRTWSRHRIWT